MWYPAIPLKPKIRPTIEGKHLPKAAGIYFLWSDANSIDYIGQSIDLSQRLQLGRHHKLKKHHRITFLLFKKEVLYVAECYYQDIAPYWYANPPIGDQFLHRKARIAHYKEYTWYNYYLILISDYLELLRNGLVRKL